MRTLLVSLLSLLSFSLQAFELDASIYKAQNQPYLEHSGPGPWDNYLTMNLPFEPVADLFKQLLLKERKQLTSRGEAHITVITPVEYWNVLRPQGISIEQIHSLAQDFGIQNAQFDILCLGKGQALVDGKSEETFFVVVNSKDLLALREKIYQLYVAHGGDPLSFVPQNYYPHITVGFSKRDLHESDGIIKNEKTCVSQINLIR